MIITELKSDEEIMDMLKPFKKILIAGCGTCSTSCRTGGEAEVNAWKEKLGDRVIGATVIEEPCDMRLVRRDLRGLKEELAEAEAILVMSCGTGAQTVATQTNKIVLPANETLFLGQTERIGKLHNMCNACGECILDETGGICPITLCAKGLLNGPCGGQVKGKCEVGGYEEDCAWVNIYNKLKEQDREDLFTVFRPPRDYSRKVLTMHRYF